MKQPTIKQSHLLDVGFDLREEVDELDVGGEQQAAGVGAAQVVLGVQ